MTISSAKQNNKADFLPTPTLSNGLPYFLIGGGIGAVIALLFAPKSGAALRADISDITRKGYNDTVELANHLKDQSAEALYSLRDKSEKVLDLAAGKWSGTVESIEKAAQTPGEMTKGKVTHIDDEPSPRKNAGRRPSNIIG
jgi:gas vesicle protein